MAVGQPTATGTLVAKSRRVSLWRILVSVLLLFLIAPLLVEMGQEMIASPLLLVQQLWVGLINGAIIAIIALGYTMVYGIIELINFAHGDVFMIGAFASLILLAWLGITRSTAWYVLYPALVFIFVIVCALCAVLNVSIERFAYRRLRNAPRLAPLISAIGVSFILQNLGLWLGGRPIRTGDYWAFFGVLLTVALLVATWYVLKRFAHQPRWVQNVGWLVGIVISIGAGLLIHSLIPSDAYRAALGSNVMGASASAQKSVPDVLPTAILFQTTPGPRGTVTIRVRDVIVLAIAIGLMVALYTFVKTTKLGKAMRATAQDRDAARLMGINVNQTIMLTFLIGGALAGAAGLIVALYNGTVVFTLGFTAGLRSFTSAVLGGIGNILGAMLGGLLIGFLSALSDTYLDTRWTNAVVFAILVVILVFRPSGLLGEDVGQKA